jgi:site-specific recombinase XerD
MTPKLKIIQRGNIWWGRVYIPKEWSTSNLKKQEEWKSSKTDNFERADKILNEWFNDLFYLIRKGKYLGNIPLLTIIDKFDDYLKEQLELFLIRKNYYANFSNHIKPIIRFISSQKIRKFTRKTLDVDYMDFRRKEKSDVGQASLRLEMNALRLVMNYALSHEMIDNNQLPHYPSFKKTDNRRTFLRPIDYKKLLVKSRNRFSDTSIKQSDRDKRFQLHQWIVFMVSCGIRVDESKNLKFKDVEVIKNKKQLMFFVKGKTGQRKVISEQSGYYALLKLKEFYLKNGFGFQKEDYVFSIKKFDYLFRQLLQSCDLRYDKQTGKKIDTKSLRQTYISWEVVKNEKSLPQISKNCGNTVEVIMSNYANNLEQEDFFKEDLKSTPFI